jgi:hypothetical protein
MYNTWPPKYLISIPEQHKCVYDIHNNRDHIDEGDRVKGDRGWRNERGVGERREVGERERGWEKGGEKMREKGDKGKKGEKGVGERS